MHFEVPAWSNDPAQPPPQTALLQARDPRGGKDGGGNGGGGLGGGGDLGGGGEGGIEGGAGGHGGGEGGWRWTSPRHQWELVPIISSANRSAAAPTAS